MSRIASIAELYVHAIAIEREAAERYAELAERMRDESNEDLAELFAGLAALEKGHLDALERRTEGVALPALASRGTTNGSAMRRLKARRASWCSA